MNIRRASRRARASIRNTLNSPRKITFHKGASSQSIERDAVATKSAGAKMRSKSSSFPQQHRRSKGSELHKEELIVNGAGLERLIYVLFAAVLVSAALYFARVVFEPIAFAFFGVALVWPLQKTLEARLPKPAALVLTVLLSLIVIVALVSAIVWSIGDVVHWILANLARFQSLYTQTTQWLERQGIFVTEGIG